MPNHPLLIVFWVVFIVLMSALPIALTVFVVLFFRDRKRAAERTGKLQAAAERIGWGFAPSATLSLFPSTTGYALFALGHSRSISNVMHKELKDGRVAVFDHVYVTGHGKHRSRTVQSVAWVNLRDLSLPQFSLRPEGLLDKVAGALGFQDIDFSERPTFSRQFVLRGENESAVRQLFGGDLCLTYEQHPRLTTDGGADQLFIYRANVLLDADQVWEFGELAEQLAERYRSSQASLLRR